MQGNNDNAVIAGLLGQKEVGKPINETLLEAYIQASRSEYDSFDNPDYIKIYFDDASGGYEITHRRPGRKVPKEKKAVQRLVRAGDRVVVCEVKNEGPNIDFEINGVRYEMKEQTYPTDAEHPNSLRNFIHNRFPETFGKDAHALLVLKDELDQEQRRELVLELRTHKGWHHAVIFTPTRVYAIPRKPLTPEKI